MTVRSLTFPCNLNLLEGERWGVTTVIFQSQPTRITVLLFSYCVYYILYFKGVTCQPVSAFSRLSYLRIFTRWTKLPRSLNMHFLHKLAGSLSKRTLIQQTPHSQKTEDWMSISNTRKKLELQFQRLNLVFFIH